MLEVSAVLITRDDGERVATLARHLLGFVAEVVVLIDDRSGREVDAALSQIERCRYERYKFEGFGPAKRKVVGLARYDWIFSIDSDEWPDEECVRSLQSLDVTSPQVYRFKRLNHYCGRPIRGCGWYPDWVVRLFHRSVANFSDDIVHESVKPKTSSMEVRELEGHILHYSFNGSHELLQKLIQYTSLYAENYQGKPKPVLLILLRAKFAFIKFYFFKKGICFGRDGFIISLMNAGGVFHKHWRAAEIARERK
ncbi:glycosyltransferase family 2 protein [Rubritalea marina]|uniref:glycosyltransferase family 2 protein n=1 Tax=Rubritalea marina TaxID=361055 RepID=UPI000380038E|nr:glycosyltransferase family 2 protein [Rubritalea marina]